MQMTAEVRIEHSYPAALAFLRVHGPDALAVLHDLLAHADLSEADLVVQASARQVAQRLGFTSKDTVNRRLRQLVRAGVLHHVTVGGRVAVFESPTYRVNLDGTGISLSAATDFPAMPAGSA